MSYTTFEYSDLKTDKKSITKQQEALVSVKIKNSGEVDGGEVVQMYVHDVVRSITQPVKELKGFQKIFLKACETKEVEFTITEKQLGFYQQDMSFAAEYGEFKIFIGTNSDTSNSVSLELRD